MEGRRRSTAGGGGMVYGGVIWKRREMEQKSLLSFSNLV